MGLAPQTPLPGIVRTMFPMVRKSKPGGNNWALTAHRDVAANGSTRW
jgi:hypothetical protein